MQQQQKVWRFLWLQTRIVSMASALVLVLKSMDVAVSFFAGGGVVVAGACIYALVIGRQKKSNPRAVLYLHFAAELAKLVGMSALVVIFYFGYRHAHWVWVFAGCLVAYSAYWLGLLIKDY